MAEGEDDKGGVGGLLGDAGAGDGAGEGEGEGKGEGEGQGEGKGEGEGKPERPAWLTEDKFWDADAGVNQELLFKNVGELTKKLSTGQSKAPEKPEGYEFELPEGMTEEQVPADDPVITGYRGKAHELGVSQDQAQGLLTWFLEQSQETMPEPFDATKELAVLGNNGQAIVSSLKQQATRLQSVGIFSEKDLESFKLATFDGHGASMMHKLFQHFGVTKIPTTTGATEGAPSKHELDARYNEIVDDGPHKGQLRRLVDPAFADEMNKQYERVYGTKDAGTSIPLGSDA